MAGKTDTWQLIPNSFSPQRFFAELAGDIKLWLAERGLWWATSVVVHALILSSMLLMLGTFATAPSLPNDLVALVAETVPVEEEEQVEHFVVPQLEPAPPESQPDLTKISMPSGDTLIESEVTAKEHGDGGNEVGFVDGTISDLMPNMTQLDWSRSDLGGPGPAGGSGKTGIPGPYSNRRFGRGGGKSQGISGQTIKGDAAIGKALRWIARHQNPNGSWSIDAYSKRCKDIGCTGQGSVQSDAGATALALLPFLAAGQTHLKARSADKQTAHYRNTVQAGAYWLMDHQKPDGDLSAGSDQVMYTHGLATIALAELFALSRDKQVGSAAQRAVEFIVSAQHPESGGWRYRPGERGDTSVVGWQVMALKSAQIAGLAVPSRTMELAHRWLRSTAQGQGGLFSYEPDGGATATMSAVGLLATQYLGAQRQDPAMQEGSRYLMSQLPNPGSRNCYYWYYATQVMHNLPGAEWDEWNRQMRRILIESQSNAPGKCSEGSWDPALPSADAWGAQGGRLMVTCLNCLTLQVYYRYLPLYQLDRAAGAN